MATPLKEQKNDHSSLTPINEQKNSKEVATHINTIRQIVPMQEFRGGRVSENYIRGLLSGDVISAGRIMMNSQRG